MTILRIARRTSLLLGSLSCGAWLFAVYLDHTMADPPDAVRQVLDAGIFAWLLIILGAEPAPAKPHWNPDPAIYGPAVLFATSLVASFLLLRSEPDMKGAALAITLSGVIGAILLWRFVRSHRDEIGEARFGPDGRLLGPQDPPKP